MNKDPKIIDLKMPLKLLLIVTSVFIALILSSANYCFADVYDLKNILKSYLKKNFPWAEIEISELSINALISEIPEKILIHQPPPGKTVFLLEFKNGNKINVTANVKAYEWIVMSSKAIRKGDYIQRPDIYLTLIDINKIPMGVINNIDRAVGKQINRSIIANMPITDIMLNEQKLVKKGQLVFIVVESPNFTIRTTGEIKANSYVGGRTKVINLASKKVITGVVIDENTVKVEF